jgi:hypothetical protein
MATSAKLIALMSKWQHQESVFKMILCKQQDETIRGVSVLAFMSLCVARTERPMATSAKLIALMSKLQHQGSVARMVLSKQQQEVIRGASVLEYMSLCVARTAKHMATSAKPLALKSKLQHQGSVFRRKQHKTTRVVPAPVIMPLCVAQTGKPTPIVAKLTV